MAFSREAKAGGLEMERGEDILHMRGAAVAAKLMRDLFRTSYVRATYNPRFHYRPTAFHYTWG